MATMATPCSPRLRGCSRPRSPRAPQPGLLPAPAGVFPCRRSPTWSARAAPRACGGVPWPTTGTLPSSSCSPRLRGCSLAGQLDHREKGLLPAPAGVFLARFQPLVLGVHCSPRLRGCSHPAREAAAAHALLPAPAGVFPPSPPPPRRAWPAPRACGGVPHRRRSARLPALCSPRLRGCSRSPVCPGMPAGLLPAPAGVFPRGPVEGEVQVAAPRACGSVPSATNQATSLEGCSPRLRGCSLGDQQVRGHRQLLPAPAGVFPPGWPGAGSRRSAPRACEGVPIAPRSACAARHCSPRLRGCSHEMDWRTRRIQLLPASAGVFPRPARGAAHRPAAPRACGGVPRRDGTLSRSRPCSPRLRGCSLAIQREAARRHLLPAPAGVFPTPSPRSKSRRTAPRACGGVPEVQAGEGETGICSPRLRGCSLGAGVAPAGCRLLPAPAGVFPRGCSAAPSAPPAPRACGGVPAARLHASRTPRCSPRLRGCSHQQADQHVADALLPAPAGVFPHDARFTDDAGTAPRACGGVPLKGRPSLGLARCSPRLRGCSRHGHRLEALVALLPAPAGVFPRPGASLSALIAAPRACGGVPSIGKSVDEFDSLLPAPAGVFPATAPRRRQTAAAPRACGGVPSRCMSGLSWAVCSPRLRGCSRDGGPRRDHGRLLPAPAGVFPPPIRIPRVTDSAPRACGGVPAQSSRLGVQQDCSPRLRGCSRPRGRGRRGPELLPAPAGVFPIFRHSGTTGGTASRACGGVPGIPLAGHVAGRCSPRLRGCSPAPGRTQRRTQLLPAPAGVFP